jgi:hypothetical protein
MLAAVLRDHFGGFRPPVPAGPFEPCSADLLVRREPLNDMCKPHQRNEAIDPLPLQADASKAWRGSQAVPPGCPGASNCSTPYSIVVEGAQLEVTLGLSKLWRRNFLPNIYSSLDII